MKLELYIEHGAPLLVFPQQIERDKSLTCYSMREGHASAARGYLRTLKRPQTREELRACWGLLKHYAQQPGQ